MIDNALPIVGPLLQARYVAARRKYLSETPYPWPERRSRKRKPIPGTYDAIAEDEG